MKFKFLKTKLSGVYIIEPQPKRDYRGLFIRVFCREEFRQINHAGEFVQINHSITREKGTVRGVHYQLPPIAEIKLIRCIKGRVFDAIVDIRKGSPTFLHWVGAELSAENMEMVYIPKGCAHGFQTLEDDCELIYHHTEFYTPQYETGIRYNDALVNISWPLEVRNLSERDKSYPLLDKNFKGIET